MGTTVYIVTPSGVVVSVADTAVRVDGVRLERVRIDKPGVGAVHGDVHVPRPCVNHAG